MALEELQGVPAGSDRETASFYLVPLDNLSGERLDDFPPIRLQWWPDSIEYERGDIGWESQQIPGLSHPLQQWTGNGAPTLSFEIVWTSEKDPAYQQDAGKADQGPLGTSQGGTSRKTPYSIDVNAAMAWLTAMTNPEYSERGEGVGGSEPPVNPPPIIQVIPEYLPPSVDGGDFAEAFGLDPSTLGEVPFRDRGPSRRRGLNLSQQADRDFYGLVDSLSGTYEKSFPSGAARYVTASISFTETIQFGDTIIPHDRRGNLQVVRDFDLVEESAGG